MANFQKMTLIIAGILLLICIIVIVLIFLFPNTKQVWPPTIANCPDYFEDVNGDGSYCTNKLPYGKCEGPLNFTNGNSCDKYTTATNCEITWDGITYGVKNPCTNNSS